MPFDFSDEGWKDTTLPAGTYPACITQCRVIDKIDVQYFALDVEIKPSDSGLDQPVIINGFWCVDIDPAKGDRKQAAAGFRILKKLCHATGVPPTGDNLEAFAAKFEGKLVKVYINQGSHDGLASNKIINFLEPDPVDVKPKKGA
jgi:hypothetical protein